MSKNAKDPSQYTDKEKRLYHKQEANKAFKSGDFVKAMNHKEAYDRVTSRQNRWMSLSEGQRDAIVKDKQKGK